MKTNVNKNIFTRSVYFNNDNVYCIQEATGLIVPFLSSDRVCHSYYGSSVISCRMPTLRNPLAYCMIRFT